MSYRPLEGVRVLDLAKLIPGGLASRKLADLGADVVKVEEPPAGDYLRLLPPRVEGCGVHDWNLNRGKRSIALELKTAEGKALFLALAEVADVILEVSVPGRFASLGIDFAELRSRRPSLVICSMSAFGQTGPYSSLPAHGMSMDGLAGCLQTKMHEGRKVLDFGLSTSIVNEVAAINAALATTAALLKARTSGFGEWIDISCWDAGVEIQRSALARADVGIDPAADDINESVLYALYTAADGRDVLLCAIEQKFWTRFCEGVDRTDLIARWSGPPGGVDHRIADEELRGELAALFGRDDGAVWQARFVLWQVPGCVVMTNLDVVRSEHMGARQIIQRVSDRPLPEIADPIRWMSDGSRPGQNSERSPGLGAHTAEVIAEWLKK